MNTPAPTRPSWIARVLLLRPTLAMLLVALFLVGGVFVYAGMVKESMPDLAIPQATITTGWPGVDSQTIELEITEPIERELRTIAGIQTMTSASFDSFSVIAVEFEADAPLENSMRLLRDKVDDVTSELPRAAERPDINQVSVDDRPIVSLVLHGDVDETTMGRVARQLEQRLEKIPGAREVDLGGVREEAVHMRLRGERLRGLGLSPATVRDALQNANVDMPWGRVEGDTLGATVRLTVAPRVSPSGRRSG